MSVSLFCMRIECDLAVDFYSLVCKIYTRIIVADVHLIDLMVRQLYFQLIRHSTGRQKSC